MVKFLEDERMKWWPVAENSPPIQWLRDLGKNHTHPPLNTSRKCSNRFLRERAVTSTSCLRGSSLRKLQS
eukprot:1507967-Pyramimonas_sp.AAC.1